jgi:hypothetical protein
MDNDSRESNPNDLFGDDVDIYSDEFWAPSFQAARAGMVDELHERLKKATQEIELINAEIEKLPLILDGNPHRIEVGRKLYWDFPTVPARTVMKVMGVKAKSAHEHAGPIYKHWDCWKCKSEVVSKEIKSRTELIEFEKSELEWLKIKRLSEMLNDTGLVKVSLPGNDEVQDFDEQLGLDQLDINDLLKHLGEISNEPDK